MSRWTESWRDFVRETSYKQILAGEKISEDQFWRSYAVYDRILSYSGYPGEILLRISSEIPAKSTFLDIGAGTGAFALPLSRKTKRTVAVDPSAYQLGVLQEKAKQEGLSNITILQKAWADIVPGELCEICCENCEMSGNGLDKSPIGGTGEVDYSLASYSMFDEDIVGFLQKMIDVSKKGVFIVFRAGDPEPLSEFAYGPKPFANYSCLQHILAEMGYVFRAEIFDRSYALPVDLALRQYRYSTKTQAELIEFLRAAGRLQEKDGALWASFATKDALLYLIH